jgi:hypothetical protein
MIFTGPLKYTIKSLIKTKSQSDFLFSIFTDPTSNSLASVFGLLGFREGCFFLSLLTNINLISGTLLCHTKIQIKFEFGSDPLISHEVMALGLRKKIGNYQFPALFSLCLQIFI